MNTMNYEARKDVYEKAIATFGPQAQMRMVVEEMAELTKEICKYWRSHDNIDAIAEEVADVTITLEQLRLILNINDSVCEYMDDKVDRLWHRIQIERQANLVTGREVW